MESLDATDVLFFLEPALYFILVVLVLVGCYVHLRRSATTHFGMAGEYEREGNLQKALKHYELAVKYARGQGACNAAKAKAAEVRRRMEGAQHGEQEEW